MSKLKTNHDAVLCVELPYYDTQSKKNEVLRLADRYTRSNDGREFLPLLVESVIFDRRADVQNGGISASFGELVFYDDQAAAFPSNLSAAFFQKLGRVFNRQTATFYRCEHGELAFLARAILDQIQPRGACQFSLNFRDILNDLNTSLKLKTIHTRSGKVKAPILWGEVFNVSPVLLDAGQHLYKLSDAPLLDILEVRDDGVPVSFTKDLANGAFTLNQTPFGNITADAVSAIDDARLIMLDIFQRLGFNAAAADFGANLSHLPRLGLHIKEAANALEICQNVAQSCNLLFTLDHAGAAVLLPLFDFSAPLPLDSLGAQIETVDSTPPLSGLGIHYAKNYTQSGKMAGGVSPDSVALFGQNAQNISVKNQHMRETWRLNDAPLMRDSLLISSASAAFVLFERFHFLAQPSFNVRLTLYGLEDLTIKKIQVGGSVQLDNGLIFLVDAMAWNLTTNRVILGLRLFLNQQSHKPKGLQTPITKEQDKHAALKRLYETTPRLLPQNSPIFNTQTPDFSSGQNPPPSFDVDNLDQAAARLVLDANTPAAHYFAGAKLILSLPNGETIEATINQSEGG